MEFQRVSPGADVFDGTSPCNLWTASFNCGNNLALEDVVAFTALTVCLEMSEKLCISTKHTPWDLSDVHDMAWKPSGGGARLKHAKPCHILLQRQCTHVLCCAHYHVFSEVVQEIQQLTVRHARCHTCPCPQGKLCFLNTFSWPSTIKPPQWPFSIFISASFSKWTLKIFSVWKKSWCEGGLEQNGIKMQNKWSTHSMCQIL